jgi:hypothetical protein
MRTKQAGYVLWKGASVLDGKPAVLIATRGNTGKKANSKTGAMIQTYILRSDVNPIEATQQGLDSSICGACPHKPTAHGTCYVRIDTGPNQVYKAFIRGKRYADVTGQDIGGLFSGELLRLGSYGDPGAVPAQVWRAVLQGVKGWTGYTHQWANPLCQGLRAFCMASCDTVEEDARARAQGWRAFTIVSKSAHAPAHGLPVVAGSFLCPASEEGGRKLTCNECLACDGTGSARKASVYIPVHGVAHKQARFNNLIQIGGLTS